MIDAERRRRVRDRAHSRCEYCLLHQRYSRLTHHVEHIVARQHGGSDELDNLALSCDRCNLAKGPNLSGVDPQTGEITALFHPRRDSWADHFTFSGPRIQGLTATGRTTTHLLGMNETRRLELRAELIARGELT